MLNKLINTAKFTKEVASTIATVQLESFNHATDLVAKSGWLAIAAVTTVSALSIGLDIAIVNGLQKRGHKKSAIIYKGFAHLNATYVGAFVGLTIAKKTN